MVKNLINIIKSVIEQEKMQTKINLIIGKKKKSDYIKLEIPKKYFPMIEILAIYGIEDSKQLEKIIKNIKN